VTAVWNAHRSRLVLVAIALYAGGAALTAPLTGAATVAVAIPSAVLLVLAGLHRPAPRPAARGPRPRRTAVAWATVVLVAAVWDLTAWLQQPAYDVAAHDHPTISLLLDPVTESWPWRFAAWCCWLYAGYRLVRRSPCAP
jgi:hypothetical protein